MSFDTEKCYKVALDVVQQASVIFKEGFYGVKKIEIKTAAYDIVTDYDKKIEEHLIQNISKVFPDHKFISEEMPVKDAYTDDPTWIMDPIDGTNNYVHGDSNCIISVALAVKKEIVIGILQNPITNQTFTAIKGKGAFLNGKPIRASKTEDLTNSIIGVEIAQALSSNYHNKMRTCLMKTNGMRSIGSSAMSVCMIAMGVWDGYFMNRLQPWDVAASSLLVTEAGGTVLDTDGGQFDCMKGRIICGGTYALTSKLVEIFKNEN